MGWVVNATLRPLYPEKEIRYAIYRRLGWPQGPSGRVRKISPTMEFDPRTVHPVAIPTALSRPTMNVYRRWISIIVFSLSTLRRIRMENVLAFSLILILNLVEN
jgi:hypothetical protein